MKKIRLSIFYFSIFLLFLIIIVIGYFAFNPLVAPIWFGFRFSTTNDLGFSIRTLWDWLELLLIPIFLTTGAWIVSYFDKKTSLETEKENQMQKILDAFIDKISSFYLKEEITCTSKLSSGLEKVLRTQVLSALRQLDPNRKAELLQIIYEMNFIQNEPKISLHGANFNNINLVSAPLGNSTIKGASFVDANFRNSNLENSVFIGSDFTNADFRGSDLKNTDFSYSNLKGVNFSNCILTETCLKYPEYSSNKFQWGGLIRYTKR